MSETVAAWRRRTLAHIIKILADAAGKSLASREKRQLKHNSASCR